MLLYSPDRPASAVLEIFGFALARARAVSQANLICPLMREISGKTAMPGFGWSWKAGAGLW